MGGLRGRGRGDFMEYHKMNAFRNINVLMMHKLCRQYIYILFVCASTHVHRIPACASMLVHRYEYSRKNMFSTLRNIDALMT